mgnify:CR=1 FL=1
MHLHKWEFEYQHLGHLLLDRVDMDHFIATQLQTVTEKMTAMILQQGEEFLSYQASVMTDLVQRVDAKKVMPWPVSALRSKQKLPQVQALAEAHSQ